jgi:hypothetical protein
MTALRPGVVAAIVRKDVLSLWPLILAALLLPLYAAAAEVIEFSPQVTTLVAGIGALATMALALTVIHQDATIGGRHDWMTRPIGLTTLAVAKAAFMGLTIVAPLFVANLVNEITAGHSWSEAVLSSLSFLGMALYAIIPVFALGLVTGSLIQAGVIGLGLVILQVLVSLIFHGAGSDPGSRWIVELMASGVGVIFCVASVAVLWRTRRAETARMVWVGGAVAVAVILTFVPPRGSIALQQSLAPGSDIARAVVTSVVDPCLSPAPALAEAGVAGTLEGRIAVENLPHGSVIQVDNSSVWYRTADGRTVKGMDAFVNPPELSRRRGLSLRYRLRPGDLRLINLAPALNDVRAIQWNYDISILEPGISRDLPIDGRRRYLPGVGFCDATRETGQQTVEIRCFKPFAQPAAVGARAKGSPADDCQGCSGVSYKPAILEGFGKSRRMWISKNLRDARAVTLTTYEARGHVARRSTTVGVPPLCPKRSGASS